jgi:hypothetical protein
VLLVTSETNLELFKKYWGGGIECLLDTIIKKIRNGSSQSMIYFVKNKI